MFGSVPIWLSNLSYQGNLCLARQGSFNTMIDRQAFRIQIKIKMLSVHLYVMNDTFGLLNNYSAEIT